MSHWFAKSLGDALLAGESLSRIEESFRAEYERVGRPPDMAVFVRHESEGRLHCEVRAYFSPAAARVARAVDAAPCNPPVPEGLDLLAGAPESWRALFRTARRDGSRAARRVRGSTVPGPRDASEPPLT